MSVNELDNEILDEDIEGLICESAAVKRAFDCLKAGWMSEAELQMNKLLEENPDSAVVHLGKLLLKLRFMSVYELMSTEKYFFEEDYYLSAMRLADERLANYLNRCYIAYIERREAAAADNPVFEEETDEECGYEKQIDGDDNTVPEDKVLSPEEALAIEKRRRTIKRIVLASVAVIVCAAICISSLLIFDSIARAGLTMADMGEYYRVTDCPDDAREVTIPTVYNGKPVTEIGGYAFRNCTQLKKITIPEGISSIGEWAFKDCALLESLELPSSLVSIGSTAFSGCVGIKSVAIPDGVTSVGDNVFSGCSGIEIASVGGGMREIADSMFLSCSALESFVVPSGVSAVKQYAFSGCEGLMEIIIGENVEVLGAWSFSGCKMLTSVKIGESVSEIGDYAFRDCEALERVIIPISVNKIMLESFYNCENLAAVYYMGGASDWSSISVNGHNKHLMAATVYYYSEAQPTTEGSFWHYVNGEPTAW